MSERADESFLTTHWTVLAALGETDEAARAEALRRLTERYWPAVYAYLRRQGLREDAAAELSQAFFADVVLGRSLFAKAERGRGRLRSFLLSALRNFRVDVHRRDAARSVECRLDATVVEAEERRLESCGDADAPLSFERRWALAIFDETLRRCRQHFIAGGRPDHWALFEARVFAPAASGNAPPALAEIPATANFSDCAAASAALQVVKRRFGALFREVVAETVGPDDDLEDEVRRIQSWIGGH